MLFNNKNQNINVIYNNECIKEVNNFKYLGVILDNKLEWSLHISNIIKKLSMIAGLFYKIRLSCPKYLFKTIYHSLFQSNLVYGINIWSASTKSNIKKLQIIQNRAIRNLYNYKIETSVKCMHITNNLLPVTELIKYNQIMHIYNISQKLKHNNSNIQNVNNIHNHYTRSNDLIHQPRTRTTRMGQNSVMNKAVLQYNKIPRYIKKLNPNQFKKELKKYIFNIYVSS